jgi:SAM-dependent methyltransferase
MRSEPEIARRIAPADPSSWKTFDLISLLPDQLGQGRCLDLGCGSGARTDLCKLGYDYVGLDIFPAAGANVMGNAESLPFDTQSFELVVAASSFEHFPDPWAAAREVARVLRPGGCAVVSLSFLEPYHARSHFHMSHLGAEKLFCDAGLMVERLEPFEWTGPEAIAQAMFQFPLARWLVAAVVRPTLWLRRSAVRWLLRRYPPGTKRRRAEEFLAEERFRFAAGIKLRLRKPIS